MSGNREYKSDVFSMLMENKENALQLYNAMNHSHYTDPELELTCRVYNINEGHNKALLCRCPVLTEYMIFVDYVRKYHEQEGYENLETAINLAINRCIEENILKDFLMENRSEVVKVTQLDYTFERQLTLEREEARRDGREEGLEQGRIDAIRNMMALGVPKEKILTIYSETEYETAQKAK